MVLRSSCLAQLAFLVTASETASSEPLQLVLDLKAESPFPHTWENATGSDHWKQALRADYQQQLARAHKDLGFKRVRMHGITCDDMSTSLAEGVSSYVNVDGVIDFLLDIGMEPLIELGFSPSWLASDPGASVFHYPSNPSPPSNLTKWGNVMEDLARHLIDRYGEDLATSWYYEVWNEPDGGFWTGVPKNKTYYELYEYTVRAFMRISQNFKLGGPVTEDGGWLPEFLDHMEASNTSVSFVSTHLYAGGPAPDCFNVERIVKGFEQMKTDVAGRKPLFITEWGGTWKDETPELDDPAYAAFLLSTIEKSVLVADILSVWAFSDVFEEHGMPHGGVAYAGYFGLMNVYGVPKPSYRMLQLLHMSGDVRLGMSQKGGHGNCSTTVSSLALRNETHAMIFLANEAALTEQVEDCNATLTLPMFAEGLLVRIDDKHANPKAEWLAMGSPAYPTRNQVAAMEAASTLEFEPLASSNTFEIAVPARGVVSFFLNLGPASSSADRQVV